jgi:hypothetical protein
MTSLFPLSKGTTPKTEGHAPKKRGDAFLVPGRACEKAERFFIPPLRKINRASSQALLRTAAKEALRCNTRDRAHRPWLARKRMYERHIGKDLLLAVRRGADPCTNQCQHGGLIAEMPIWNADLVPRIGHIASTPCEVKVVHPEKFLSHTETVRPLADLLVEELATH